MTTLSKICPNVKSLRGVSNGIPNDFHISDRYLIDDAVCDFVKRFHNLTSFSGKKYFFLNVKSFPKEYVV